MPRKAKPPLFHFQWEVRHDSKLIVQEAIRAMDFMAVREKVDAHVKELVKKKKIPTIPSRARLDPLSRWKPIKNEQTGRIYNWYTDGKLTRISVRVQRTADPVQVKVFAENYLKSLNKPCGIDDVYRNTRAIQGRCSYDMFASVLSELENDGIIQMKPTNQSVQWIPPSKREPQGETDDD